jgi:hypothetical protein
MFEDESPAFSFQRLESEILRISKEGIWVNPDIPLDEAAKALFEILEPMIIASYKRHAPK